MKWLALAGCFAAACAAQAPDYFPLAAGNVWIYQCVGACDSTTTLSIDQAQQFNGTLYYRFLGFGGRQYWLREDESGSILAYDPTSGQESTWYVFGSPPGEVYDESLPSGCCGRAMVTSGGAHYEGPVGTFDTALQIQYPGVFQVGVYSEMFLPYVGLLRRGEARGGPAIATYDLIYARLGGVTVISRPEVSFTLSLDRPVYFSAKGAAPVMTARLALRNTQADPITLTFNTTQAYDLEVRNANGDVVYRWSDGKVFGDVVVTAQFGPGEKDYTITAPLALPAGKYVAQAWLTAQGPARAYSASMAFEIR